MLLRLHESPAADDVDALLGLATELGYRPRFLDEERRLVDLAPKSGQGAPEDRSRFEDLACVASVLDHKDAPERAQRAGRDDAIVRIGDAIFGGGCASIVAGPCHVGELERTVEIARTVRSLGATVLRGGAFKPRTSPYAFAGSGDEGLDVLARVKAETGIAIVTEVLDPRDVERIGEVADAFQIGARSMANSALLREVGALGRPVLLKRGFAARAREFLLAAETILASGNPHVVLCERGVRGFDTVTRNVLDLGTVAWLKRETHLPVVVDPSHAAGRADLVRPLARAGIAVGADGLVVEVHPRPAETRSDGAQALSFDEFAHVVGETRTLLEMQGRRFVGPESLLAASVPLEEDTP